MASDAFLRFTPRTWQDWNGVGELLASTSLARGPPTIDARSAKVEVDELESWARNWYTGQRHKDSIRNPVLPLFTARRLYALHGLRRKLRFAKPRQWKRRSLQVMRADVALRASIEKYWALTSERDAVSAEAYIQLNTLAYIALVPRIDDPGLPARSARDDWRFDCRGKAMNYDLFFESLCAVADVWAPGSTDSEYAGFLDGLFARISNGERWLAPDEVPAAEDAVEEMLRAEASARGRTYDGPPPAAPAPAAPPAVGPLPPPPGPQPVPVLTFRTPRPSPRAATSPRPSTSRPKPLPTIPYERRVHKVEDGALLERLVAERVLAGEASEALRTAAGGGLLQPYIDPAAPGAPAVPMPPRRPSRPPSATLTRLEVLAQSAEKAMRRSDLKHARELSVR